MDRDAYTIERSEKIVGKNSFHWHIYYVRTHLRLGYLSNYISDYNKVMRVWSVN